MSRKLIYLVLALGLTLMSTAGADMVGWWKLDETSGTVASDSSGYGNNGTLQGDTQWVDGAIGGAIGLDGPRIRAKAQVSLYSENALRFHGPAKGYVPAPQSFIYSAMTRAHRLTHLAHQ